MKFKQLSTRQKLSRIIRSCPDFLEKHRVILTETWMALVLILLYHITFALYGAPWTPQ